MDLYDRIEKLLKERGVTKKALCESTGISYNTLASLFKRRSKRVEISTLQKIADFLHTSIEYLTTGDMEVGTLTETEAAVIFAFRAQPAMQDAVKKLLGIK